MKKRILFLSPHTDDAEIGAGGFMAKLLREGHEVYCVAFSSCPESLPGGLPKDTLVNEMHNSMRVLGVEKQNVYIEDFQVRYFERDRQLILERMIELRNEIKPSIVVMPSKFDIHQDHEVIHNEAVRAFKYSSLLGYEIPWNNFSFTTNYVVSLRVEDIKLKTAAISCYASQSFRGYDMNKFETLARFRGAQVGEDFAEAFHTVRWIERD